MAQAIVLQPPTHHEDDPNASHHVHWVELFYDLIQVVCIFQLGNLLGHHHDFQSFLIYVGLFIAIWVSWAATVFYTSLYITNDVPHRLLMALQIVGICIMAIALGQIPGVGIYYFAVAFAVVRGILALLYWRAGYYSKSTAQLSRRFAGLFITVSVAVVLATFLPYPLNYLAWTLILLAEQLAFVWPKVGLMSDDRFKPRLMHLSERFTLLFLIVMGEGFFKLVLTLSEQGIQNLDWNDYINATLGCLWLFSLTWIYFDFVGNGRIKPDNCHMILWWYGHLLLMLGASMNTVAIKGLMTAELLAPFPMEYGWLGCLGLIWFLIATILIQAAIKQHTAHQFYSLRLRLFGIGLALLTWILGSRVPAWFSISLFIIAYASQIASPLYHALRGTTPKGATPI